MISSTDLAAKHIFRSMAGYLLGAWLIFSVLFLASLPASAKGPAARADVLENCNWNRPGVDPFMGDVVAAVDRYTDIAQPIREQLKERMRARQYDEIVLIKRDSISGKQNYNPRISEMHFGPGRVCRNVTRAGWSDQMQERGLVYCVQGECILVPTVCRNVSRITRAPAAAPGAAPAAAAPAAAPVAAAPEAGLPAAGAPAGDLHSGSFAEAALVPAGGGFAFISNNFVGGPGNGPVNFAAPPSSGMGGGQPAGPGSSSFIETHPVPPITILPTLPTLPTGPSVLPAVPEPQTWAMLLAGLALLGYCARHNKSRQG
ncbi:MULTISPECIES: MHFG family PEP-CTERM protein [unclassified Janthinobacterium]|uniref:MHFG family PEP-CTERM protein n=1 Tax=unclassified Janthinobacterium TaxID=2610881 RepID=UPI001614ACC0|nr:MULTISPECIES: MHFG family PEP-CTERM protein [unclassified Janthinobacterium]MBB5367531.1 hypothetical protein [Janthinobacterium sp. K2C7]MBB5379991.1 hypothetical protein [Janthinobacterium sp. K2Li3]MBB5385913.1 hypothetical protein [Janthinobacterium sp. K2E3]